MNAKKLKGNCQRQPENARCTYSYINIRRASDTAYANTNTKGGIALCRCTFNMVFFLKETISSSKFCSDTSNE